MNLSHGTFFWSHEMVLESTEAPHYEWSREAIHEGKSSVVEEYPGLKWSWGNDKAWNQVTGLESLKRGWEFIGQGARYGDPGILEKSVIWDDQQSQQQI